MQSCVVRYSRRMQGSRYTVLERGTICSQTRIPLSMRV
jgi:hypothetical protein